MLACEPVFSPHSFGFFPCAFLFTLRVCGSVCGFSAASESVGCIHNVVDLRDEIIGHFPNFRRFEHVGACCLLHYRALFVFRPKITALGILGPLPFTLDLF